MALCGYFMRMWGFPIHFGYINKKRNANVPIFKYF